MDNFESNSNVREIGKSKKVPFDIREEILLENIKGNNEDSKGIETQVEMVTPVSTESYTESNFDNHDTVQNSEYNEEIQSLNYGTSVASNNDNIQTSLDTVETKPTTPTYYAPNVNAGFPYSNESVSYYPYGVPYPEVGLNVSEQRRINYQIMVNTIDEYHQRVSASIAYERAHMLNIERFMYQKNLDDYADERKALSNSKTILHASNNDAGNKAKLDTNELITEFKGKFSPTKIWFNGQFVYYILDGNYNRHIPVPLDYLKSAFIDFVETSLPNEVDLPDNRLQRLFGKLKHSIPKLEQSKLIILKPHQIMLQGGYIDILSMEIRRIPPEERPVYFATHSIDVSYDVEFANPDVFDKLLADALGNNEEAIQLMYEQIGAILTPISTLKKVFVFQGVSNGGKTRIVNIITRLMQPEDTLLLDSLTQISGDNLIRTPIRLIHVKELGKNKIPAKQIAKLKAFADGSSLPAASSFKIVMTTNYAISTDDNGIIEPALKNRLSVIPFSKAMDNSDPDVSCFEDIYFEREKPHIILKALYYFSKVLKNNNKFSVIFEPNTYIEGTTDSQILSEQNIAEKIDSLKIPPNRRVQFHQTIQHIFSTTEGDVINPDMNVKKIIDIVNQIFPNEFKDEASAGKRLREIFGEKLKHERIDGKTCYNLVFKPQQKS